MRRVIRRAGWTVVVLLIALTAAGGIYQSAGSYFDARRSPELGRLVEAGGIQLQLHCSGSGQPTIVLEAGLGDLLDEWRRVQPEIAKLARVCAYDRAGYGASDLGTMPRTSRQIATELHTLLRSAGERPPFVLVGSSFGGYNVRVYHGQYPNDVAGMVLVDSTQEDQYRRLPAAWRRVLAETRLRFRNQSRWSLGFVDLGFARMMLRSRGLLSETTYRILQSKYVHTRASELESIEVSAEQARSAGGLGDKPLIVLTAAKQADAIRQAGLSAAEAAEFEQTWVHDLQLRLVRLSGRGERILLEDSGHDVPAERPDAVISAVRRVAGLE